MKQIEKRIEKAFNYFNKGYIKQAEILYLECLDKIDEESIYYTTVLHGLGYVNSELRNFSEAIKIYKKLLQIARVKKNKKDEAIAYHQLGTVEQITGNSQDALSYFAKERDIYEIHFPEFHLGWAVNLYESGTVHMIQREWDNAKECMLGALEYAKQTDDLIVLGNVCRKLGEIFKQTGEKDKALQYFQNTLALFRELDDRKTVQDMEREIRNI